MINDVAQGPMHLPTIWTCPFTVYMCVYVVYVCVVNVCKGTLALCEHTWRPEVNVECLPYFLRQDLSVSLELMSTAKLAAPQGPGIFQSL